MARQVLRVGTMGKRSKKLLKTKAIRKAFKQHPFGTAAALVALGGLATAFGGGGTSALRRLKDGTVRRLLAARNALQNDETVAQRH